MGHHAVITNKDSLTTEALPVEYLALRSFVVAADRHIAQLGFVFGSYDSNDRFHIAHTLDDQPTKAAVISIGDVEFRKYFLDSSGNLVTNYDFEFFFKLLNEIALPMANDRVWGFEDIDITLEDPKEQDKDKACKCVYKREKKPQIEVRAATPEIKVK